MHKTQGSPDYIETILESISDAFLALDFDWRFTYVNHHAEVLLQRTRAALLGRSVWDEFSDAVNSIFYQKYHEARDTQIATKFEDFYAPLATWFEVRAYPSKDGLFVYFHDITRQKLAEEEREQLLQRVEAARAIAEAHARQVEAVLASMTEGIIIADPQGNIIQMNDAAARIHGFTRPEEFQRHLKDFPATFEVHALDGRVLPLDEWPLARLLRGDRFTNFEVYVRQLTTATGWFGSYNGGFVRDEQGNITLAILTLRDITTQKAAEEHLRASEERFRLLCDNAPIGIAISHKTSHLYTNQTLVNMFGYDSPEELAHQSLLQLVEPQSREQIAAYIKQREHGEAAPVSYELVGLRKDGSTFVLAVDVGRISLGDTTASITFTTDITERKEAEHRKDDFLSMASHELRTPLTSVKAYTQILQHIFEKEEKKEPVLYLAKMDVQLNKLTKLITDLLDTSKMQGEKVVFAEEEVDFDMLLHETIGHLPQTWQRVQVSGQVGRKIIGDKKRLEQALTNILANALKYSSQKDAVLVTVAATPESVLVQVQDFGIGIAKQHHKKVFERFYRVYTNNDTTYPGLGVGLSIAHEVITRHNGTLWVESAEGQGATFSFSLPFEKKQHTTKREQA